MMPLEQILNYAIDYGIFFAYAGIFWQLVSTFWKLRHQPRHRHETLLSILLLVMIFSVLVFVAGNAYMLNYTGHTLLSMRIFQMFVIANCFVYWLTLTLIKRGGSLHGRAST